VLGGNLPCRSLELEAPATRVTARVGSTIVDTHYAEDEAKPVLRFRESLDLKQGEQLELEILS